MEKMKAATHALFSADDWGFSPGINAGVIELAKRRLLHSVSLVANAAFLENQLEDLCAFKEVQFSLHFNLTHGRPLTPARLIPSLVNADGEFHSHRALLAKSALGQIQNEHLVLELRAQFNRLRYLRLSVESINGHHHIHLWPPIFKRISAELLSLGLVRLRWPNDPDHAMSYWQSQAFLRLAKNEKFQLEPCRYLTAADQSDRQRLEKKLQDGDSPLLVHPALYNDFAKVKMSDSLQQERVTQLQLILEHFDERERLLGK